MIYMKEKNIFLELKRRFSTGKFNEVLENLKETV